MSALFDAILTDAEKLFVSSLTKSIALHWIVSDSHTKQKLVTAEIERALLSLKNRLFPSLLA